VIAALVLVGWTRNATWDLAVSILVAAYIFKEAIHILKRAVSELLDRGLSNTELKTMKMLILRHHPSIVGAHNLRSRLVGNLLFLDFHIEIRGEDDFKKAHNMTESLIDKIKAYHPNADVTVHFDPEGE
jgi:divalent metal cation (Fe/Co/Zn/Cd) transporter